MWQRHATIWLTALVLLSGCASSHPPSPKATADADGESAAWTAGALAPGEPKTPLPVEADDARVGAETAQVTLIAFLDYECRYCRETFAMLLGLREKYGAETLRLVFKHLPLEGHPMALPAAIAGQAVSDEAGPDAFIEFSTLVFGHQGELSYANLAEWAASVGVARSVYNEAVTSETTLEKVATDARLAMRRGAEGTPTLFVNGRLLAGAPTLPDLTSAIDAEHMAMQTEPKDWARIYAARVSKNAEEGLALALLASDPLDYRVPVGESAVDGSPEAPVTLVVFTDYQCPYCKRADATLRELMKRHPGELRLVFKHLPLPFHAAARPAARLAEAVRQKAGSAAFFQVSGALFDKSPDLGPQVLTDLGRHYGLDDKSIELATSGESAAIEEQIDLDLQLADDVEAAGTPHVFINGKRVAGARPLEHFEAVFHHEKERADERLAEGVSPAGVYEDLQARAVQPGAPTLVDPPAVDPGSPTRGPALAPVTIHVFSDFECPYCRQAELTLVELERLYPQKLRVVWHDRPLDFHPLARPAARAGREAARQGGQAAFWKLHALMFGMDQERAAVSRADLLAHAKAAGLDIPALEKAIDSDSRDAAIDKDIALATSLGFQGTPAFVIGRYALTGARDLRHFRRLVDLSLDEESAAKAGPARP